MSLDNDENRPLYETISNKEDVSLDERIELENSMCTLTEDEKNIIMSRYYEDLTQCEVARKLSMSKVMVSRYEKIGIEKMRNYLSLQYKYHHLFNNNSGDFILNKEEYKKLVKSWQTKEPKLKNAVISFLVGGGIGILGQVVSKLLMICFGIQKFYSKSK